MMAQGYNRVYYPQPYAFRSWATQPDFIVNATTSSAEWHEGTALELGDRVSNHYFMEMMWHAWPGGCWPGLDVSGDSE